MHAPTARPPPARRSLRGCQASAYGRRRSPSCIGPGLPCPARITLSTDAIGVLPTSRLLDCRQRAPRKIRPYGLRAREGAQKSGPVSSSSERAKRSILAGWPSHLFAMEYIRIRGARTHNLKNINLDLPRHRLIVITGLSGSGKSSLAFDTLYAEGQRRYVESLSAYARQFLPLMEKPDVDLIEGLSPAISIDQQATSPNP